MAGCARSAPGSRDTTQKPSSVPGATLASKSREVNDVARFLAGLPALEGSPFVKLQEEQDWKEHVRESDQLWANFVSERRPAMQRFENQELKGDPFDRTVVFYPFSGPDALTVVTLFPRTTEYVLAALEPPGTLPSTAHLALEWRNELPALRGTLSSLLGKSFFVTREMDRQLRGQVTDGVMPLLLVELVRTGHTVDGFGYVGLDEKGNIVPRKVERRASFGKNRGLVIEARNAAGNSRTMYYFSLNLDSRQLKGNTAFLKYASTLPRVTTMLKSTSYMLHQPMFDVIRNLILEQSAAVVQDDSGIPYRCFSADQWQVQLYGDYERPYGSFKYLQQKDLREAYLKRTEKKELGFRMGYGFSRIPSNLQVAKRRS